MVTFVAVTAKSAVYKINFIICLFCENNPYAQLPLAAEIDGSKVEVVARFFLFFLQKKKNESWQA